MKKLLKKVTVFDVMSLVVGINMGLIVKSNFLSNGTKLLGVINGLTKITLIQHVKLHNKIMNKSINAMSMQSESNELAGVMFSNMQNRINRLEKNSKKQED